MVTVVQWSLKEKKVTIKLVEMVSKLVKTLIEVS